MDEQNEELEVLLSIYGDEFRTINELAREYSVIVKCENSPHVGLEVRFTLPCDYPSRSRPRYELINKKMIDVDHIRTIDDNFTRIWDENFGSGVLYSWVEFVREYLQVAVTCKKEEAQPVVVKQHVKDDVDCPVIHHGAPFTDRKSTFQAHVAAVTTSDEVKIVLRNLMSNHKIAKATHNIMAYRIMRNDKVSLQDCDDDGETAAGGRLLHLLEILDINNAVVVVTRWYGGILLGPDRFKHINNVARECLDQNGFITATTTGKKKAKR